MSANLVNISPQIVEAILNNGTAMAAIKKFTRLGKKVVLKARDSKYDIPLKNDAEYSQKYRAIAEFKGVLG